MKKLFTLLTLLLCVASSAWADTSYYTPTADEVIILNDVYSATATTAGYSTHSAIAWGGTGYTSNKTAGDPSNNGAATSEAVTCFSAKGNGKGKNINVSISGCSKIIVYHESQSERYLELRSESKTGDLIAKGNTNTYYTEVDLDGTKSYSIFLHGTKGTDDQDFYVYAVKLTKYVKKEISTQELSGVKVNGTALTENASTAGYSVSGSTITLTDVAYVVPTNVTLTNHITYTDNTTEDKSVAVTFDGTVTDNYWIGSAAIGTTAYTVKVPYDAQVVTAVTINGSAISADDLSTLISEKTVSIDGSSLNGIGMINVTLSGGSTTVTRTFSGNDVTYAFTINGSDNYTVTFTGVKKTYTAEGSVFSASSNLNANTYTASGITFTMVNTSKNFQYGSARLNMGEDELVPVKLSTGSAVNVTFPNGKKAIKVIVYGWSANGDGKLYSMKESENSEKSVNVNSDVFYATNVSDSYYPSVYEYDLDNWESMYFNPGGSPSQPFVVMDFVFAPSEPSDPEIQGDVVTLTTTASMQGWRAFYDASSGYTLDENTKAYVATKVEAQGESDVVVLDVLGNAVPQGMAVLLKTTNSTQDGYSMTLTKASNVPTLDIINKLKRAGAATNTQVYRLGANDDGVGFFAYTKEAAKPDVVVLDVDASSAGARSLTIAFADDETTAIHNVNDNVNLNKVVFDLQGRRVLQPGKGLYIVNGKKVVIK